MQDHARSQRISLIAAAVFLAVGLLGILNHEMWRDEAEIWLIARDSASLPQLFANMSIEGHPALWYLINFVITRFTHDPFYMQLVHLLIAGGAVLLVLRCAPFGLLERILFCFGYFFLYEYTVISRSYGLEFLLIFLVCALYGRRREFYPWLGAILLLLANTNLYGAIIGASLGVLLFGEAAIEARRERRRTEAGFWLGTLLFVLGTLAGVGHVYYQYRRIGPSHFFGAGQGFPGFADSLSTVVLAYLPLPNFGDPHFWNTSLLEALPATPRMWVGVLLGAALLACSVRALADSPRARALFLLGATPMLCITFLVWYGQVRQHGHIYLLFFTACWIAAADAGHAASAAARRTARLRRVLLSTLFVIQVAAGGYAFAQDYSRPFSNSKAAALLLDAESYRDAVWIGSADFAAQAVAAHLQHEIYYPESARFGTFVYWGRERKSVVTPIEVGAAAESLLRRYGKPVVIITNYRLVAATERTLELTEDAWLKPLGAFEGAIVLSENYFLYLLYDPTHSAPRPQSAGPDPGESRNRK